MILPTHILDKMSENDRRSLGKAGRTQSEIETKILAGQEKELQKQICQYLNLLGIAYGYSANHRKTTYTVGWPDYCFAYRDKMVCWEAKTSTGKSSPDQIKIRILLENHPVTEYRVIRSLKEAQNHLREIERNSTK